MTVLGRQRLLPAQLILDFAAVALAIPHSFEFTVVFMDLIWGTVLPLILLSIRG